MTAPSDHWPADSVPQRWCLPAVPARAPVAAVPAAGARSAPAAAVDVACDGGTALAAGWYLLSLDSPDPGPLGYGPDYGDPEGIQNPHALPPAPAGDGARDVVVLLERQAGSLRLVPGPGASAVALERLSLRRLGTFDAVRRMLAGLRARRAWTPVQTVTEMLGRLFLAGPSGAMALLVRRYRRAVADRAGWPDPEHLAPLALRRWPWGRCRRQAWLPAGQLERSGDDAVGAWEATGGDPCFVIPASRLDGVLPAGWYRFDAEFDVDDGQLRAPELYPDCGEGFRPEDRVALPDPVDGRLRHFLRLQTPARALRFDPTTGAARFRLLASSLVRLNRAALAWQLLASVRGGDGRPDRGRAAALAFGALVACLGGPSRGAAWLLARCQPPIAAAPGVACALRETPWTPGAPMAVLRPLHQLRPVAEGEGRVWDATGGDPQFLLDAGRAGAVLPAGWYRFRCRVGVRDGQVISPCFYPDYGQGFRADDLILVPDPDDEGRVNALVLFKFAVKALRFDPSLRRARFALDGVSLTRLSKPSAFVRMLDGIRDDAGRPLWGERVNAATGFATALRKGPSTAAAGLFSRYQHHRRQGAVSYDAWVRLHDTLSDSDIQDLRAEAAALPSSPLFSILVPVYQTPEPWLRRCLDSVLAQAWPHWELCIAEDASPSERVREVLREYQQRDPRIRVEFRAANGHIAAASNTALAMARGDFVGLLDHDDELRPHSLLEMAKAIHADPDVQLLYSDEDKIDAHGRRFQPYFKPDWNPDLLRGQNYMCHFSVLRTALARDAGGFRVGYEGSQDHDLLLRCSETLPPAQIRHVPHVLYHWRAIEGSTALHRDAKDYAADAGARAVQDHLRRTGAPGVVEQLPHGHYRVHWQLPTPAPRVTLVIPTRDRVGLLRTCIDSIVALTTYPDYRILVVDNGSVEDDTLAYLEDLRRSERAWVIRDDQPFNFSRINNAAVAACDGELVCLVNNDIEVISADWLEEMAGHALRPGVGAVGAMLYYPDDTIQHAGVILGIGGVANHAYIHQPRGYAGHGGRAKVAQELSAVTGACLMVRRETYLAVGGLDERFQVAFNDIDFCLRLRERGLRNLWTPFAELYHHESASRGREDSDEKLRRFHGEVRQMEERWGAQLGVDPAYNRNLTLDGFNFELAFPPREH